VLPLRFSSLSHCLQLRKPSFGQLLCPVCHFVHYVLRYASFHHVRCLSFLLPSWQPVHKHITHSSRLHIPSQSPLYTLTGLHSAPLRPSLTQSRPVHPLPIIFARLACHRLRFGASLTQDQRPCLDPTHKAIKGMTPFRPCTVRPSGAVAPFPVRPIRWHSQPPSFRPDPDT